MRIGFLHTTDVHERPFDDLLRMRAPDVVSLHRTEPEWLTAARAEGLTAELQAKIAHALDSFDGADVVICTCSTLGPLVDRVTVRTPVVRIDRPMLEEAVRLGRDVLVAYCLESTRAPTLLLLNACAVEAGREVLARPVLCDGAWPYFEAGDAAAFAEAIEANVAYAIEEEGEPQVIALAQASMRGAADPIAARFPHLRVLTTPGPAVERALALAQASSITS